MQIPTLNLGGMETDEKELAIIEIGIAAICLAGLCANPAHAQNGVSYGDLVGDAFTFAETFTRELRKRYGDKS